MPSNTNDDELRLLSKADLCNDPKAGKTGLLNVSDAAFDRWVADGVFPRGVKVGKRAVRWRASTVRNWIDSRAAESLAA